MTPNKNLYTKPKHCLKIFTFSRKLCLIILPCGEKIFELKKIILKTCLTYIILCLLTYKNQAEISY
jgi:hypothetical protein